MTSKYDRLADHLATFDGAAITLTFAAVEAVVGPLPKVAYQAAWWGATPNKGRWYPHTYVWRDAGYVAERPDFKAGTVTFRRVAP